MVSNEMKILIFDLNGEYYATDILDVERILEYQQATEMPDAPSFVEGVINYEDKILPIINLIKKFNMVKNNNNNGFKIIVIKREEKKFGILVENVYEVSDISKELLEDAPPITVKISENYIKGLIKLNGKIIILLDIDNILKQEDEEKIF